MISREKNLALVVGASMMFALAAADVANGAVPNPLGPAANGDVQCYQPDDGTKTCESIAAYRALGAGRYVNKATVLVSPDGPVTFETSTIVEIKRGVVCGAIYPGDLAKGKVRVSGRVLTGEQAVSLRSQIAFSMKPMLGREICTRYEPSGSGFIAKGTIAGYRDAVPDQAVKWISPNDGYSVAP